MTAIEQGLRDLIAQVVREELDRRAKSSAAPEYLSTKEAAAVAHVASGTIRRWLREGKLIEHRAGRVVRVARADLDRLLHGTRRHNDDLSPEELAARAFADQG